MVQKRYWTALASICMLLVTNLLLAACGGTDAPTAATSNQKVTLQYWNINTKAFGATGVDQLIKNFEQAHPNITVESHYQEGSYTGLLQKLQASITANNPPDVTQVGYLYTDYVANTFPYQPIEDLAKTYKANDWLSSYPANILKLGQIGGKQVGMPYSLSNIVTYYNADLFKKAGLDPDKPPTTWDQWQAAGEKLKAVTAGPPIYLQFLSDNWDIQSLINSNGGELLACNNGHYQAAFTSPEAVQALEQWTGMVRQGTVLNALQPQGEQAFISGKVAVYMTTIASRANLQKSSAFTLRGTNYPRFGDKPLHLPGGGNNLFIFSKDAAKQQAALSFVQYLTSAEGFTVWTKQTGYVPLLPNVTSDPRYLKTFVEQNPIEKVAVDQLPQVVRWTSFPGSNGLAASQALFQGVQQALGGQVSPAQALQNAAQKVNAAIGSVTCSA
ncbi:MAG: ABC transporter substrate-binding protein [Ktedonobacteraceae bacterium]